jgi:hypothetical protein
MKEECLDARYRNVVLQLLDNKLKLIPVNDR